MVKYKSQVSFEYLIIMGFLTFVIVGILSVAYFFGGNIRDQISENQLISCGNKIITTAEAVFYAGEPSKATIKCQFPENVKDITIDDTENVLQVTIPGSSGDSVIPFFSEVPITGSLSPGGGVKRIQIVSDGTHAVISQV